MRLLEENKILKEAEEKIARKPSERPPPEPWKPFMNMRTEYYDDKHKKDYQSDSYSKYSYSDNIVTKPQMFSYFLHDMEKEE